MQAGGDGDNEKWHVIDAFAQSRNAARLHEYNVIKTTPLEYLGVVERDISKWKQSHFSFVIIVNNFKKQYFIGFIYCVVGDV